LVMSSILWIVWMRNLLVLVGWRFILGMYESVMNFLIAFRMVLVFFLMMEKKTSGV
jgi:hypothetical protein